MGKVYYGEKYMIYRIDPKTRRIIVSDLTPPIRGTLSEVGYFTALVAYYAEQQAGLLNNLAIMNENLESLLDQSPNIRFRDKDSKIKSLDEIILQDSLTNAMVQISYPHHEVHDGCSFTTVFTDETLADAETIVLAFKTPRGTKRIHLLLMFTTLVGGSLNIWQDATWTTTTGVVNPIINRKQEEDTKVSGVTEDLTTTPAFTATGNILSNPTLTGGVVTPAGATSLDKQYAWGEKGKIGAGYLRDENEFILRPDTTYAIVFTSIGAANKAQVSLNWYEH